MPKKPPKKEPEQLYFDGTAPPPDPTRTPDLDAKLWAWLESRDEQRRVGEKRKDNEHLLMHALVEAGIDKYPFTDSVSGKKRYFVADKTPKPKTIAAFEPKKPKAKKRDAEEIAKREETEANRVEQRRVPRASVADEIGEGANADPFRATRELLEKQTAAKATEH